MTGIVRRLAAYVLLAVGVAVSVSTVVHAEDQPIRVLVVAGGGFFETSFFDTFTPMANVSLTVSWSDQEAFHDDLRGRVDVVVLINRSATLPEPQRSNLRAFVEAGGGVIVVNQAMASYGDWPWWHQEVTGARYLSGPEGEYPSSAYRLNEPIIAVPSAQHPITRRLQGLPFHIFDETFLRVWMNPEIRVLAVTRNSSSDGPLMWLGPSSQYRVVVQTLGLTHGAHFNLAFRYLMEDSVRWAAGRLE
jgi:type 1 glutamine amidotransferase